jgi:hypothetical protein
MEDEQALWEVASALGSEFDADAARTRAHAAATLLALVSNPDSGPAPFDREWDEGHAMATVKAAVTLLQAGTLDAYLANGDHELGAAEAIARTAPLPDPKDLVFAHTILQKLYDRRHPAG